MKLLLIDDAKEQYTLIKQLLLPLKHLSFEIDWVAAYDESLTTLQRNEHDVCLIDYQLGEYTGIQIIEQAIAQGCTVPMIMLTGFGDYGIDVAAMQAGAVDYLDKTQIRSASLERAIRYAYERSQAQKTLLESEERYRDLFENSRELIQSVGLDGEFLYVNRSWREILGYTEKEVDSLLINTIIHPDYRESCLNHLQEVFHGREARNLETVFLTKDGREIVLEGNLSCRVVNGKAVATRGIFRDITARKQAELAEREQRAMAEALRDTAEALNSTLDFDEILDRILVNVAHVVPHDSANIMLVESGKAYIVRYMDYTGRNLETGMNKQTFVVAQTPTFSYMIEARMPLIISDVHRDPQWIKLPESKWIKSYAALPISLEGNVIGFLNLNSTRSNAFSSKLIDRLQAFSNQIALAVHNAQLYQQAQELAALNERQRLANDLHDAVSQTLFSASIIAETLFRTTINIPDQMREDLNELWLMNRRALSEMRSLLLELRPRGLTETPIEDLITHLVDTFKVRGKTNVSLNVERGFSLPDDVQIMVYRVVQEALNNITKHTHAHEVNLTLRHRNPGLELSITDDGSGFDLSAIPANHFGVKIMHERAESVGAVLTLNSQLGKGTTITLVWPASNI